MSDEVPSLEDLKNLRVVDLKKELVRLGLPQGTAHVFLVCCSWRFLANRRRCRLFRI